MTGPYPTRRDLLSGVAAGAVVSLTGTGTAQAQAGFERFLAACRDLTAFDPLPPDLVRALADKLDAQEVEVIARSGADLSDGNLRRRVLHALYRGLLPARTGEGMERIGYAEALMFAAVDDTLNVPSYCGGLPAYWAAPPADV